MGTNMLKTGFLITVILFLLSASCNKDKTSCLSSLATYSFDASAEWLPEREIYNIGDTIFIASLIPKMLIDKISNTPIEYSNAVEIGGSIIFNCVDTNARTVVAGKDSFNYVSIVGDLKEPDITPEKGKFIRYSEKATNYEFKAGIVCQKRGIYMISFADLLCPGLRRINCTKGTFTITITNTNKHVSLYQNALGITLDAESLKKIYCFRVM